MTTVAGPMWRGCAVPEGLLYDLDADVWLRSEGADVVVGMTDVAQTRGGRVVQVGWKKPGSPVRRGRPLAVIESAKWVGPMRSPLTGVVVANNQAEFDRDIAIANRDPYELGWFYRLRPSQLEIEQVSLSDPREAFEHYRKLIDAEGITCMRCVE